MTRVWNIPHYRTHHSEYAVWFKSWSKILIAVAGPGLALYLWIDYLWFTGFLSTSPDIFFPVQFLYPSILLILLLYGLRRTSSFKEQWIQDHQRIPNTSTRAVT